MVLLAVGYTAFVVHSQNFHTILQGELYRSAQLSPQELDDVMRIHGIQTVFNLRGTGFGQDWYDSERALVQGSGARYISVDMKSHKPFSETEAADLIGFFERVKKPILIHCKAGADRTGLAAALYLMAVHNVPLQDAQKQLSIKYGHFSLPFLPEFHMDRSLFAFEAQKARQGEAK